MRGVKMKINILGRTGYKVTALGLGCYQFTGEFGVAPDVSESLMNLAMESEINLFDTAQMYGFGESEEILGRGLLSHPGKKAFVSTKVGYLHDRTITRAKGMAAYTDETEIIRSIKHSLWLLRRDFVEIIMIHEPAAEGWWNFDFETGDSIVLSVLEKLKKEGVIGAIGLGDWNRDVLTKLVNTGRFDVALSAGGISLLGRPVFDQLIPAAKKHNVGIIVGGAFGQNNPLLINTDKSAASNLIESENPDEVLYGKRLMKIYEIAGELNISMTELAIRYIISFDEIHSHIPGARNSQHVISNLNAAQKGPLDENYVKYINQI